MTPIEAFRVYEDAVLRFLRGWNPQPDDYEKINQARPLLEEVVKKPDIVDKKLAHYESIIELMSKLP